MRSTTESAKETQPAGIGTESPDYLEDPIRGQRIYDDAFRRVFEFLYSNHITGDILEFGTYKGFSAALLARLLIDFENRPRFQVVPSRKLWCFDSFEAFPASPSAIDQRSYEVTCTGTWAPGAGAPPPGTATAVREMLTEMLGSDGVDVITGFYEQTLPSSLPSEPVALIHLDCDLYASSRYALEAVLNTCEVAEGCVLLCDDYNCNRADDGFGQRRAVREVIDDSPEFARDDFFSYGWNARAFILHQREAEQR
ncbi:hypothetical protein GCM10009854_48200 [Saccharopolyspora halophila]|uniref:Methyltransferase n=1 Tax=Saccharopolyspora halophila TaxID=405551 RepID=A0ABP5TVK0_9PSEU